METEPAGRAPAERTVGMGEDLPEPDLNLYDQARASASAQDAGEDVNYEAGFQDGFESARVGFGSMIEDVREFHEACGTNDPDEPTWPSYEKRALRYHLQFEETDELSVELLPETCLIDGHSLSYTVGSKEHLAALAKEIVDVIYVAIGTALSCGIPLESVWDEIHTSNMAKVDPITRTVRRRHDGKILKPEGWEKPDIKGAMFS